MCVYCCVSVRMCVCVLAYACMCLHTLDDAPFYGCMFDVVFRTCGELVCFEAWFTCLYTLFGLCVCVCKHMHAYASTHTHTHTHTHIRKDTFWLEVCPEL